MRGIRLDISSYPDSRNSSNSKNMEKIEISKVTLNINGLSLELTLDQARELKEVLGDLFKNESPPLTYPIQPIIIETYPVPRPWEQWQTWCSTQGNYTISHSGH